MLWLTEVLDLLTLFYRIQHPVRWWMGWMKEWDESMEWIMGVARMLPACRAPERCLVVAATATCCVTFRLQKNPALHTK